MQNTCNILYGIFAFLFICMTYSSSFWHDDYILDLRNAYCIYVCMYIYVAYVCVYESCVCMLIYVRTTIQSQYSAGGRWMK
jgi:hypothetical protein